MYLCVLSVRRVVTVSACERFGVPRPVCLRPGLHYVARCEGDHKSFCVRRIGWFAIPEADADAFVVRHFTAMFSLFWQATPSPASVSRLLRCLGFRSWTPGRVRWYARWLKKNGPGGAPGKTRQKARQSA